MTSVTQIGTGTPTTWNFTYNSEDKLATIVEKNSTRTFTYSGNTILINKKSQNGSFDGRDSITLNNNGKPVNIRRFNNQAGTSFSNIVLTYDGDNLAEFRQSFSTGSDSTTNVATYQNGNMVLLQSPASLVILDYLAEKKGQSLDYLDILSIVEYGIPIYPHKSLVKSLLQSGKTTSFSYIKNDQGLVSKIVATLDAEAATISLDYDCK